jgi:hypothetical protein
MSVSMLTIILEDLNSTRKSLALPAACKELKYDGTKWWQASRSLQLIGKLKGLFKGVAPPQSAYALIFLSV